MTMTATLALLSNRHVVAMAVMASRGGGIVTKFLLTLFIAKFMGLETLGIYGMILGAVTLGPVILGLGLMNNLSRSMVTQSSAQVTAQVLHYGRLIGSLYALVFALAMTASIIVGSPWLMAIGVLLMVQEQLSNDLAAALNSRKQYWQANSLMLSRTLGWMLPFMAVAFVERQLATLPALLTFWMVGNMVTLAMFVWFVRGWPWFKAWAIIKKAPVTLAQVKQSMTLYINDVVNTSSQYLDRYVVGFMFGLELTGVYVLFWSMANALSNLISNGVIQIAKPKMIEAYQASQKAFSIAFNQLQRDVMLASVALAAVASGVLTMALPLLNNPLASAHTSVLWIVMGSVLLRMMYEAKGVVFYSVHRDDLTLKSALSVLLVSLALNLPFGHYFGLEGTATAMAVSYFAGILMRDRLMTMKKVM